MKRREAALLSVIGLALACAATATPAQARTSDRPLQGSGYMVAYPEEPQWYGAYSIDGTTGYCADLSSGPPRQATGWSAISSAGMRKQTGWGARRAHGNGTSTVSAAHLAQIGWLLHETGPRPAAPTGAAIEHAVRTRTLDGQQQKERESSRWRKVLATHPAAGPEFTRLSDAAVRFAGPYTAALTWVRQPTAAMPTGELTAEVRSAAGHRIPGKPITVRGTGDLRVVRAPSTTGADGIARISISLPVHQGRDSSGTVQATLGQLAGTLPGLLVPREKLVQRILTAPPPVSVAAAKEAFLRKPAQPPAPTPTPKPTPVPSPEPSPIPTPEPSPTPTPEPSPSPTPTPTPGPTPTPSPTPSTEPVSPSPSPTTSPTPVVQGAPPPEAGPGAPAHPEQMPPTPAIKSGTPPTQLRWFLALFGVLLTGASVSVLSSRKPGS